MYADKVTKSMAKTIDETGRRRRKQAQYNTKHGITPQGLNKSKVQILGQTNVIEEAYDIEAITEAPSIAADPVIAYMSKDQLERLIARTDEKMKKAAKELDFITAAQYRDELFALKKKLGTAVS